MKTIRMLVILGCLFVSLSAFTPHMPPEDHWTGRPRPSNLAAPTLIYPENGVGVPANPTLTWSAVSGAARYHVQAGRGPWFDQQYNFIDRSGVTTNSYYIAGHPEAYFKTIYWRVRAIDASNNAGPWSATGVFTITTPYQCC